MKMNKTIKTMSVVLLAFAFVLSAFAISPKLNAEDMNSANTTLEPQEIITPMTGNKYYLNFKFDPQVKMDATTGIRYVNIENQNIYISVTTGESNISNFKLLADIGLANPKGEVIARLVLPVEYIDTAGSTLGGVDTSNLSTYVHTYVIRLDDSADAIRNQFGDSVKTETFTINVSLIETNDYTGKSFAGDSIKVVFSQKPGPVPQPSTVKWTIPSNEYMKINGIIVGSADLAPYVVKAGNPLTIEAGYVSTTELPTLIILEEVGTSNKAFFYPVLEKVDELNTIDSASQKTEPSSYEYVYSSQIYKDLKPNTNYKVTFKVYPETTEEKISLKEYNYAYNNYVKSISTILSFSKAPSYSNRFILKDMFGSGNGNGWEYGTTESKPIKAAEIVDDSQVTNSGQTIVSSGSVNVVLGRNGASKGMRSATKEMATEISEEDIIVDVANSGQASSMYINQNNQTKKIKNIETVLSEGQINSEDVYGDVQLVNIDDVPKYVFTVKEQNKLFGFIPFGTKKVEKIVNATENLK